ncbi:metallophosphoesterase [Gemmatimonas sp.]|uniref:metallophosphoesterase n=1 Tax=Gemmatimonas sp. TaxID=1962908 RepID=UPI00286D8C4A|nr:metallophosphoesterase [Gemmatimonas sp.]
MISRRAFLLTAGGMAAAMAGTVGYTFEVEPEWLDITQVNLQIRKLPASMVGKRVVQFSDIHIGPGVSDDYVRESFATVDALTPDVVVVTGDLISQHPEQFEHAEAIYAALPHGSLGTFVSFGNHDYGRDWAEPAVAARLRGTLENLGITVLVNEVGMAGELQVVGLGDLWAKQFDPVRAFSRVDPAAAQLALSHNPDSVDLPGWGAYDGWVLAGHTHGGQCKPPFLPPPMLPVKNRRYTSGAFDLSRGRQLYINRGLGTIMYPVRFNVRPEVTVFSLQSAD